MIYRALAAIFAAVMITGAAGAQSTAPSGAKPETNCTTSPAATTGSAGDEKTSNSMAMEKSAVLPDAGGSNSAAPTVQSGNKPMEVRSDCPPDSKAK
jgi:hypothetical protein